MKLMLIVALLAMMLAFAAPALADDPKVIADAKAKTATAGAAKAEADCKDGMIESNAGGVVAKAPCKPPPPAPAPKAEAPKAEVPPAPPKAEAPKAEAPKGELPKTGGGGAASLFALGAGALLVGGGLLVRRII